MTDCALAFRFSQVEEATAEAYGHQNKDHFPLRLRPEIVIFGYGVQRLDSFPGVASELADHEVSVFIESRRGVSLHAHRLDAQDTHSLFEG